MNFRLCFLKAPGKFNLAFPMGDTRTWFRKQISYGIPDSGGLILGREFVGQVIYGNGFNQLNPSFSIYIQQFRLCPWFARIPTQVFHRLKPGLPVLQIFGFIEFGNYFSQWFMNGNFTIIPHGYLIKFKFRENSGF
jgi:hypothetical protein